MGRSAVDSEILEAYLGFLSHKYERYGVRSRVFFDGGWLVDVLKSEPSLEERARIVLGAAKPRGVEDIHHGEMVFLGKIGSRYVFHVARWGIHERGESGERRINCAW